MLAGVLDPCLTIHISDFAFQFVVEKIKENNIDFHSRQKFAVFPLIQCFNVYLEELQNSNSSNISVNRTKFKEQLLTAIPGLTELVVGVKCHYRRMETQKKLYMKLTNKPK